MRISLRAVVFVVLVTVVNVGLYAVVCVIQIDRFDPLVVRVKVGYALEIVAAHSHIYSAGCRGLHERLRITGILRNKLNVAALQNHVILAAVLSF